MEFLQKRLKSELIELAAKEIGAIANLILFNGHQVFLFRSGKIMRRILRKIASNVTEDLGDTTTLADPTAVDELITNREQIMSLMDLLNKKSILPLESEAIRRDEEQSS